MPESVKEEPKQNQSLPADDFRVVNEAVMHCDNKPYPLEASNSGVIAKVPVVLAGFTLELNLNSQIYLPERVTEIRQNKKRVKITQCKLMADTDILFVKGLIYRDIEYLSGPKGTGKILQWNGETPFNCTTNVKFNGGKPIPTKASTVYGVEYLNRREEPLTCDTSEFNQISTVFYNEQPFCELVGSKIVEAGGKRAFNCLEEKMIIYLTLKILQYQQVAINSNQT